MGIAYSDVGRFKAGNVFINTVKATVSNDDVYEAGGYDLAPADAGLQEIIAVLGGFSTGHHAVYAPPEPGACSGKLVGISGGTEVPADPGTELRDATADLVVLGR